MMFTLLLLLQLRNLFKKMYLIIHKMKKKQNLNANKKYCKNLQSIKNRVIVFQNVLQFRKQMQTLNAKN